VSLPYTAFPPDGMPVLTCCQRACPVGTDISTYLALIAQGKLADALAVIREVNPFPSVCGRVCDHPCEAACRRAESDQPVAIRALKRMLADHERTTRTGWPEQLIPMRAEKVAIIGAGPAGLTAASDLLRHGFAVTVFEALPKPGGMMRVGIPDYRLPGAVLDDEIEYLRQLGVEIRVNSALGRDFTLDDLGEDGYTAVLLATGAHGSRKLTLPGADWSGMMTGIDFLRQVKIEGQREIGRRVVVIGGGDVAMDTARTALRLGAERVDLVCLEQREQMPAHDWETREALDEQITFHCGWGPQALTGDGDARTITFAACTALFDASGRFAPVFDNTQTIAFEADVVLTSVGQYAVFSHRLGDDIAISARQLYQVDPETLQTTAPWVFAAGDAVYGTATVIKAIASGHRAAAAIREYLDALPLTGRWEPCTRPVRIPRGEIPADWEERSLAVESELPAGERTSSFAEVRLPLPVEAAIAEAARCMRCDAETKSYSYNRNVREQIYHLARDLRADEEACLSFLRQKLEGNTWNVTRTHRAALEDLVFLPANLTRLVIDPYREACNTRTVIGARAACPLVLDGPVVVGGVPYAEMDATVTDALCRGAAEAKIAIRLPITFTPPAGVPVIGIAPLESVPAALPTVAALELLPANPVARLDAEAIIYAAQAYRVLAPGVPLGLGVLADQVEDGISIALAAELDFVTLSAMPFGLGGEDGWRDESGYPDICVLARAVEALRALNREEDLDLLYFGGIRNGADVARALSLGAKAALIGHAACLAVGIGEGEQPRAERLQHFVKALLMETSILARCCGKTDVQNLEPEDMSALTVETSMATGIPLVGWDVVYRNVELSAV